eukprot:m.128581 g.128581  ORF g.128581 m.128581 type:complete len:185 (+) comp16739_c0_seq7:261-815(+)
MDLGGSHLSQWEACTSCAARVQDTKAYTLVYVLIIVVCIATMAWSFADSEVSVEFVVLEMIVNMAVIFEVVVRIVAAQGIKRFATRSWLNAFDLFMVIICVLVLIYYVAFLIDDDLPDEKVRFQFIAEGSDAFIVIRSVIMTLRLSMMLKTQYSRVTQNDRISLGTAAMLESGSDSEPDEYDDY